MDDAISPHKALVAGAAIAGGLVGEDQPVAGFVDIDGLNATVALLHATFPGHFLHAFAVKAGSILSILRLVRAAGMGCEVASPGELALALAAGFAPERIVFDSPAKTRAEIALALGRGMTLNVDSFQELARVDAWMRENPGCASVIGIRVNPQVGGGSIAAMSTATDTSKFGIGLADPGNRQAILEAYRRRPWLTAVHAHVGSQGCPLELIGQGLARTVELAQAVNAALGRAQVATIDIGGGLPVNFADEAMRPSFADYAAMLRTAAPALFGGEFRVVTELGRSVLAKNGFILARVEYTKTMGGRHIAITHAGAQVATRTVFMPDLWPIRISALDPAGRPKTGDRIEQDVAGPCCFAGDIIAHRRQLPLLEQGDWILAHDTGAYYFSTPFVYNSLPRVAVHGFETGGGAVAFTPLRRAESLDEVLAASQ
jgi:diaminopimelate decarboxylase